MRRILERLFKRTPPASVPAPVSRNRARWTAEEDRRILAAAPTPVKTRTSGRETEIQVLARLLGRSEQAIRDRRVKLADPGVRAQLASAEAERAERDRNLIKMIQTGASIKEAAQRAGVSKTAICQMLKRKAPALDRSLSQRRGYERREARNRVARDLAPRVLDAAADDEGLVLSPRQVADLARGEK